MAPRITEEFMSQLKRYLVPVAALVYVLGFAAKLHEYFDKLGWRLVAVAILALAIAWAAYIWFARELSTIEPKVLLPRFNFRQRAVAALIAIGTAVPVWFAIQPEPPFKVPPLGVRISNPTKTPIPIKQMGEFYLTAPQSPVMDTQVAAGRLRLVDVDNPNSTDLNVPAGGELRLLAVVLNPQRFKRLLEARELSMRVIVHQANGTLLTAEGVPFDPEVLGNSYVALATR